MLRSISINYRVNVIGLVASILTLYVALSNDPWWVMSGGDAFHVLASPFLTTITILGKPVEIPILPYLFLSARLGTAYLAITMLIGSLLTRKMWSRYLMNYGLLWMAIGFISALYIGSYIASNYYGISYSVSGETMIKYPIQYQGITIVTEIPVSTYLTGSFWLALLAGIMALASKITHNKILTKATETPK